MSDSQVSSPASDARAEGRTTPDSLTAQIAHVRDTLDEVRAGAEAVSKDVERVARSLRIAEQLLQSVTEEHQRVNAQNRILRDEALRLRARIEAENNIAATQDTLQANLDGVTAALRGAEAERDAALTIVTRLEAELASLRRSRDENPTGLATVTEEPVVDAPAAAQTPETNTDEAARVDPSQGAPARLHGGIFHAMRNLGRHSVKEGLQEPEPEVGIDRVWSREEDHALLVAYEETRSIRHSASRLTLEEREVAKRLVHLLLSPIGAIDDESSPNFGQRYSDEDKDEIRQMWREGWKLPAIARDKGRSQLGIGWLLLDDATRPVEFYASSIYEIVDEVHAS